MFEQQQGGSLGNALARFSAGNALVQVKTGTPSGSGATTPVVLTAAPSPGNVLILVATAGAGSGIASLTQTGVVWTAREQGTAGGTDAEIWQGVVSAGASATVSIVTKAGAFTSLVSLAEFSMLPNAGTFASGSTGTFAAATTSVTPSVTPAVGATCLIIAVSRGGTTFQSGPINGFQLLASPNANLCLVAYQFLRSPSGSYSTAWTFTPAASGDNAIAVFT